MFSMHAFESKSRQETRGKATHQRKSGTLSALPRLRAAALMICDKVIEQPRITAQGPLSKVAACLAHPNVAAVMPTPCEMGCRIENHGEIAPAAKKVASTVAQSRIGQTTKMAVLAQLDGEKRGMAAWGSLRWVNRPMARHAIMVASTMAWCDKDP